MISLLLFAFIGLTFIVTFFDLTNIGIKRKKRIFFILCVCAILIETFREGIGFDYGTYIDIYNLTPPISEWSDKWQDLFSGRLTFIELAYLLLNGIVQFLFGTYEFVFFIMACITFFAYYRSMPEMTPYIFSTFLMYLATVFFYKELGQIRHGLAMSLSMYSVCFLIHRRRKKFLFYDIIASMFHKAVIPIFLLVFLKDFKWKKWTAFWVLAICGVLYSIDISNFFMDNIARISVFADQTETILKEDNVDGLISIEKFLLPFIIAVVSIICLHKGEKKFPYYHIELTMLLIGIAIMAVLHGYKEFGQRLSAVFILSEVFLLPQVCIGIPKHLIYKILGWIIILVICSINIIHTLESFPMP